MIYISTCCACITYLICLHYCTVCKLAPRLFAHAQKLGCVLGAPPKTATAMNSGTRSYECSKSFRKIQID